MESPRVREGDVQVEEVDLVTDTEYCKVWYVYLTHKDVEVLMFNEESVHLRRTRWNAEHVGRTTVIELGLSLGWSVICDVGRYLCRIVAYRVVKESVTELSRARLTYPEALREIRASQEET